MLQELLDENTTHRPLFSCLFYEPSKLQSVIGN